MNVGVSVKKNRWLEFLQKCHTWNPSTCDCECDKTCKIGVYLYVKNCSYKRRLFGKLVLACEDEILNATETTVKDLS